MRAPRTTMTASLHSVKAIVSVAAFIALNNGSENRGRALINEALDVLQQPNHWPDSDPVIDVALRQLRKLGL